MWLRRLLAAALTLSGVTAASAAGDFVAPSFDYYVLSLSWSPSYCEAEGGNASEQQCARGRPYAFVVHGLWPQKEHGFAQNCPNPDRRLPQDLIRSLYDIIPATGLIIHEWRAHGSCTGLGQQAYFDLVRKAREAVTIPPAYRHLGDYRTVAPDEVERAFLSVNPAMKRDGTSVSCDSRYLREIRICMTKELQFRSCAELERRTCRAAKVVMPPVRGG